VSSARSAGKHFTSPRPSKAKHRPPFEDVDGLRFYRTPLATGTLAKLPIGKELALMKQLEAGLKKSPAKSAPTSFMPTPPF
jgi:hypothetical protein